MSFIIENPWLIQDLIKIGQGQTIDPTEGVSPQQAQSNMALKLLDQLQKQFSPVDSSKPAEISTESGEAAKLTTQALENIGALVSFLAQNKITVNGKLPVYDHDPGQEEYQMYKLEGNALQIGDPNRDASKMKFWINPELLSAYIVSLQAQNAQKPNRVLETYLKSLIQESNKLIGTQVSSTYQSPGQKTTSPDQVSGMVGKNQSEQTSNQTGQNQQNATDTITLADLAAMSPFNSNFIDFNQIMQFISGYMKLAGSRIGQRGTSALQQEAAQVQTSIGMAENVLNTGGGTIQLSDMTPDRFRLMAKNGNQAHLLANFLYTVISFAGSIYQDFVTELGQKVNDQLGASAYQFIQQQIAPGGPQQANMAILNRMMSML